MGTSEDSAKISDKSCPVFNAGGSKSGSWFSKLSVCFFLPVFCNGVILCVSTSGFVDGGVTLPDGATRAGCAACAPSSSTTIGDSALSPNESKGRNVGVFILSEKFLELSTTGDGRVAVVKEETLDGLAAIGC